MFSSEAAAAWQDVPDCLEELVPFLMVLLRCFFLSVVELPGHPWLFCALGGRTGFAVDAAAVSFPVTALAGKCREAAFSAAE